MATSTGLTSKEMREENLVSPPYPDPLEALPYWGRGTGEDITQLPPGWEGRVTPEGRVFWVK